MPTIPSRSTSGNPSEITVTQLAEEIIALVEGTKSKIVYDDLPEDDPKRRRPDITKAQTLLGWNPDGRSRRRVARGPSSTSARWSERSSGSANHAEVIDMLTYWS